MIHTIVTEETYELNLNDIRMAICHYLRHKTNGVVNPDQLTFKNCPEDVQVLAEITKDRKSKTVESLS